MSKARPENDNVLDELSEKLGTLEALLDNLERNKNKEDAKQTLEKLRNQSGLASTETSLFEHDSLDDLSSLSGLSSGLSNSNLQDSNLDAQNSRFSFEPDSLDSDSSCPESSISFSVNNQSAVPVILPTCNHSIPPGHFPETPPDTTPENSPRESIEPLPPSPIETMSSIEQEPFVQTVFPATSSDKKSSRNINLSTFEKHKKGSKSQNIPKKTKTSMSSGPGSSKDSRPKPKNGKEKRDKSNPLSKRKVSTIIEEKDDHGPDDNSESETVSIKNIQFLTEAENTDVLEFMMKSKEYENEILNLQHELAEYDQVESRIQKHLDSVTQWASIEQSKRNSLRKRMEQTILNLEQQKTHIVGLERQVERARTELEELRGPSAWLYFTIAILLLIICYWGIDVNYPYSYV